MFLSLNSLHKFTVHKRYESITKELESKTIFEILGFTALYIKAWDHRLESVGREPEIPEIKGLRASVKMKQRI